MNANSQMTMEDDVPEDKGQYIGTSTSRIDWTDIFSNNLNQYQLESINNKNGHCIISLLGQQIDCHDYR